MILIIACLCILVLMAVQRFVYTHYWCKNLNVDIKYKYTKIEAGEKNELVEIITNDKMLPLPMLHVKFDTPKSFVFANEANSVVSDNYYRDDVFTIMGHQMIKRTLTFRCEKRGCYFMHDTNITSSDLFLNLTLTARRNNSEVIHVFPKKINLMFFDIPFKTITGSFVTQRTLLEDPFEFKGIREYQPYDGMKKINYKASAKHDKLMVNTYFMTSSQEVWILLNLDMRSYASDSRLAEGVISLASSIAEKFIGAGIPVGIMTNALDPYTKEQIFRESGSGTRHMLNIDTALSRIDTKGKNLNFAAVMTNSFKSINDNAYYLVISNQRNDSIIEAYETAKHNGMSSYFLVPELKNMDVLESISDMVKWNIEF